MVVMKTAKSRQSSDVIGATDEMNGLNQGHIQGQRGINFHSIFAVCYNTCSQNMVEYFFFFFYKL